MLLFGDFFARNIFADYMHLHICAKYFSQEKQAFRTLFVFSRGIFCQIICICTFAQSIVRTKHMRFIHFPFFRAAYFAKLYAFAHLRKVLFKTKTCVSYVFHFFARHILPDYMHLYICAKYCSKKTCVSYVFHFFARHILSDYMHLYICEKYCSNKKHAFHTFFIFSRGVFCQIVHLRKVLFEKNMRFIRFPFFRAAISSNLRLRGGLEQSFRAPLRLRGVLEQPFRAPSGSGAPIILFKPIDKR